jgi:hypothetical protein
LPSGLEKLEDKTYQNKLYSLKDVIRNKGKLRNLCVHVILFREKKYLWRMLLIYNPKKIKGPFWFLPHDDENTAFKSALYATRKYGGGFLSILSSGKRYFNGQDPNRNFGTTAQTANTCKKQKYAAPMYSKNIFKIIDTFKMNGAPYLALHNNKNGWHGNGGSGGISVLNSSKRVKSYKAGDVLTGHRKGIKDEDSMVYIASTKSNDKNNKVKTLIRNNMHVKYEMVNEYNNDCSMSNYVVLNKGEHYFNIESEHGDFMAQKAMIDKLMKIINIPPLGASKKSKFSLF